MNYWLKLKHNIQHYKKSESIMGMGHNVTSTLK